MLLYMGRARLRTTEGKHWNDAAISVVITIKQGAGIGVVKTLLGTPHPHMIASEFKSQLHF